MKSLRKNTIREFTNSLPRYFSVVVLLALSVFVFVGLNAVGGDMRASANKQYDRDHLADAQITSTIAFDDTDKTAIENLSDIDTVEFYHKTDEVISGTRKVLRVESLPESLSTLDLDEGRLPKTSSEIVLGVSAKQKYDLDEVITLNADGADDIMTQHQFTIVGFIRSSEFLKNANLGNASIGDGQIFAYAYVPKEDFKAGEEMAARLNFKGLNGQAYDSSYEVAAANKVATLQKELNTINAARISRLRDEANDKIADGQAEIADNQQKIDDGKQQAEDGLKAIDAQLALYPQLAAQLNAQKTAIQDSLAELDDAQTKIDDAKKDVASAQSDLKDLDKLEMLAKSRNSYADGYSDYGESSIHMDDLARTFPVIFFVIAVLVTVTVMSRMVTEKRVEMGSLRAMGTTKHEVISLFTIYSGSSAVLATVIGAVVGLYVLPNLIFAPYQVMYGIGYAVIQIRWDLVLISLAITLASTLLVTWLTARRALSERPIDLIAPQAPAQGSRILLERVGFIWKRLKFSYKVTARNIFRYKSRMLMTILGVAGSTGLIVLGLGIQDSLNAIVVEQFGQVVKYDAMTTYKPGVEAPALPEGVKAYEPLTAASLYATNSNKYILDTVTVLAPQDADAISKFVNLDEKLTNDGAIFTDKIAKLLGVGVGDTATLKEADGTKRKVRVAGITKNYVAHYLYMTPTYYAKVFGETAEPNGDFVNLKKDVSVEKWATDYLKTADALQVTRSDQLRSFFDDMIASMGNLVYVIIGVASLLSVVIIYTLTNINVSERIRELSTLKVLGFYKREVLDYIYRESNILTLLGIVAGLFLGWGLHDYIMTILPPSAASSPMGVSWWTVVRAAVLTFVFGLVVRQLMKRKIDSVDMLEALKSVD